MQIIGQRVRFLSRQALKMTPKRSERDLRRGVGRGLRPWVKFKMSSAEQDMETSTDR
jgi:hypothetical protein